MNVLHPDGVLLETRESAVRSYSRSFPTTFTAGRGEHLVAEDGTHYLDFLSGAGSLNYGHNPAFLRDGMIEYLSRDGLLHGLDLATTAKRSFLETFATHVLDPRDLDYRVQFCSPSGTNAVEAALKLARLATGRTNVVAFGGAFHGVSTGSLAVTGADFYKRGLYRGLAGTTHVPYPVSPLGPFDSLDLLRRLVEDSSSGVEKPAAVIVETVQGEGGVYVAPDDFLRGLREWCTREKVVLVVDDIQVGCGRTGGFFSFERAGIRPDVVTLSKSVSASGLPMAVVLLSPELDIWAPGQHNGTFRGNQLAFVTAEAALRRYWADGPDGAFEREVTRKGRLVRDHLARHLGDGTGVSVRGLGMIWGIDLGGTPVSASEVSRLCFERGLVVETCGRTGTVLKVLPPLTISDENLVRGLDVLLQAHDDALRAGSAALPGALTA